MPLPFVPDGIFRGVRVIDLTRVLAGPYCTMLLSDLGAEVIKIEEPTRGDSSRWVGDAKGEGFSSYFNSVNRNKLSVTLDLTRDEGRALLHRLVARADVVISNFRPEVLPRLGCDYASLKKVNPRIIHCAISGFGQDGPYRDRAAYDLVVQAMGGGMDLTGYPDGEPAVMGLHVGDQGAGLFATFAIAAALYHRERTGEGQDIDISMLDCQISLLGYLGQRFLTDGEVPRRKGRLHAIVAPFGAVRTQDGYIAIVAHSDKFWPRLCTVLERPEWIEDARFATVILRQEHADEIYALIEPIFAERPSAYWLEALTQAGLPCGSVNTASDALTDPQVLHRRMVVDNAERGGTRRVVGNPIKSSAFGETAFGPPPALGEHTELVLRELLEMDAETIAALREMGAI